MKPRREKTTSVIPTDLSFPCSQALDDGVFNLGLDEDEHHRLGREETHGMLSPAGGITSMSVADSRPDALDLALMGFTASASKGRGSVTGAGTTGAYSVSNSPFCDAVIRQSDVWKHRPTNGNAIKHAEERSGTGTILPTTNSPLPQQRGDTDEKTCEIGGLENEDDLLAKASKIHLSVAVQLRNVKELLKRKSFIYIDTSWSARRLPCPPTAWKGKQGVNPPKVVDAVTDEANRNSSTGCAYATTDKQANVFVSLEGRWATPVATNLRVGIHSNPGEKMHKVDWRSQDAGMALAPLDRGKTQALFAVFDGHGINGREASRQCMERLPKYLNSISRFGDPASALRRTCHRLHRDLASSGIAGDCSHSGTTLCAAILTGRRLTIANVGDSGCIRVSWVHESLGGGCSSYNDRDMKALGNSTENRLEAAKVARRTGKKHLVIERLSWDHKPECKGELERIEAAGGVVFPLPNETGGGKGDEHSGKERAPVGQLMPEPERNRVRSGRKRDFWADVSRVWKPGCDGPGLAMSRSIGDKLAHSVGVTHEPEITELSLDPLCEVMLVLASDGVWDVLDTEDIRKIAESHCMVENDSWCPQAVSEDICRKSRSEWLRLTRGESDDITCLVIKTS